VDPPRTPPPGQAAEGVKIRSDVKNRRKKKKYVKIWLK
jgi:hypothetical protein